MVTRDMSFPLNGRPPACARVLYVCSPRGTFLTGPAHRRACDYFSKIFRRGKLIRFAIDNRRREIFGNKILGLPNDLKRISPSGSDLPNVGAMTSRCHFPFGSSPALAQTNHWPSSKNWCPSPTLEEHK